MDATGTERAVMVSLSRGAQYLLELARLAPERVAGAAFIGPMFPYTPSHWSVLLHPRSRSPCFERPAPVYRWWGHMNAVHWRAGLPRVRGVVHLALLPGAALDQGHRGRGGMGAGHRPRDADRDGAG